jgi:flagellar basal body-associated protein FliL
VAKKTKTDGDAEAKGGKKKMIIIAVVAVVGLYGAKTMLMKAPDAASVVAAKAAKEQALTDLCARQNAPEASGTKTKSEATTTTTVAGAVAPAEVNPLTERGGVLEMEPLTVNLADGHYLKIGLALQLDKVAVAKTAKEEGLGAKALDMAIATLSTKTMAQLSEPKVRAQLKHTLGLDTCEAYEGEVLTVYFTNFVMQ